MNSGEQILGKILLLCIVGAIAFPPLWVVVVIGGIWFLARKFG